MRERNRHRENFPVGSFLIKKELRPLIHAYYAFARTADDIADSPTLTSAVKKNRLHKMRDDKIVQRFGKDASDLLIAFVKDGDNVRYATWDALIDDYCMYSAAPVGRFLLALHGETPTPASDALCNALQILNHLQDIKEDAQWLGRIYLPQEWMRHHKVTQQDCVAHHSSQGLGRVIHQCLDGCDILLQEARPLIAHLKDGRLRLEAAVILSIAHRLTQKLRRHDPLAQRVALGTIDYLICFMKGIKLARTG